MRIQFISTTGDWSLLEWPAVPAVGDHVYLPNEDGEDAVYRVKNRAFDHCDTDIVEVWVEYVGPADESVKLLA